MKKMWTRTAVKTMVTVLQAVVRKQKIVLGVMKAVKRLWWEQDVARGVGLH